MSTATQDVPASFITEQDAVWTDVGPGLRRRVISYDAQMMLVKVTFETGGVGALHHHVHVQQSYIQSGVFEVTLGEEKRVLQAGDAFYVPSDVWHGVVCLEAGVLLDAFSPMREDFV
ncbi:cupin domain-containing protein [Hymenobacter aquaticus]|uniref:Cupin domain-containing protein n=1 Tax=Hymenobacter aquaticus TaxID=1867101 RepID=A0A4Z0Q4K4_9BACT|nr:cupin domain-containing protein [Hymenobacter aquaticus]TGE24053.1 cupin domain-containing protein [Hymenobacter aquaticus]